MFGSRKRSLTIVLTVVGLLAMLAPAAMAAPEVVQSLVITNPTAGSPVYWNPDRICHNSSGGVIACKFPVAYTLTIGGTQVDHVHVSFQVIDQNGNTKITQETQLDPGPLATGANSLSWELTKTGVSFPDGWYNLKVCAWDEHSGPVCDTQVKAIALERSAPDVDLENPEWKGYVTGKNYPLVGTAEDRFGVTKVEFQYCDISNSRHGCVVWDTDPSDPDVWKKIATGAPSAGVSNQWEATWDSSSVPDEWPYEFHGQFPDSLTGGEHPGALIRMCAWNHVDLSNCYEQARANFDETVEGGNWPDAHKVFVNNHWLIELEPGWNLISTPLMPYNTAPAGFLTGVNGVKSVWSYVWNGSTFVWKSWAPGAPSSLATIMDGPGYWVNMAKGDETLDVVGTWLQEGPVAPPQYFAYSGGFGWNLIGYTQWGRPMWQHSKDVGEYLGPALEPNVQTIWRYDAGTRVFKQVQLHDDLMKGAGYWLATVADGPINP